MFEVCWIVSYLKIMEELILLVIDVVLFKMYWVFFFCLKLCYFFVEWEDEEKLLGVV